VVMIVSLIAAITISPMVGVAQSAPTQPTPSSQANPRRVRIQDAWQQVYQRMPDLPRENQYVSRQTGKVDPNNTLVTRLIRYHHYVKGRPVNLRLDWKFTFADFMDLNDPINPAVYPGSDNLRQNPFESDRAALQRLNRKQRDALIQALVSVFNSSK
jgi:hypothetical protein